MRGSRTTVKAISIAMLAGSALLLTACSGDGAHQLSSSAGDRASDDAAQGKPDGMSESMGDSASGTTDQSAPDPQALDSLTGSGDLARTPTSGANASNLADVTVEREIIATAEMTLRSEDVGATVDAIESIAAAANGFVSGQDVQNNPDDPDRTRATIVLRVPTPKLDSVIDQAKEEGDLVRVTSDEQDVTQTVIDVNSRVESARASVDRIRALLSQARTIGEVVRIESELSRREADLESLLAQQRQLADQTELATLSVTVLAPEAIEPAPKPAEEEEGFVAGLERGWNALVDVVVVALTTVGVLLPFVVVALLILIPILLAWRRRRPTAVTPHGPAEGTA